MSANAFQAMQRRMLQLTQTGYFVGGLFFLTGFFLLANDAILSLFAERVQGTAVSYGHTKKRAQYSIYQYRLGSDNYQTWSSDVDDEIGSKRTILYWQKFPSNGYIEGAGISEGFLLTAFGAMLIGVKYAWRRTNLNS
jgi:hypothetical protein